ncbi:hypothetical protein C922_01149 [Plasmodium inui San Antonio 1]|uniref:Tryptophan/threonine-rich plasmodium antigen C-terminal domain-containing protein n=1 Tax=Plasmodium inui San Antonio 1 TaxID=1237626 RepID=W7ARN5_9APIC|nr:hypothetical protein C922_01149 [Plasmodium inui San Antonio 1]EUD68131.1 hypothetical protein C922_01149 [Plasmodium inui San Antonio 1]
MKYNKYSIPKETVREGGNASEVVTEYQMAVLSEEKSVGGHGDEEGNVYFYNEEGMQEGEGEEGIMYYYNEEGMQEGEGEKVIVYYYNEEGMEEEDGEEEDGEGGDGEEGDSEEEDDEEGDGEEGDSEKEDGEEERVYYHSQEDMEKDSKRQMHNLHGDGMPIIDPNNEDLEHEQGENLPRIRKPDEENNVDRKKLVLTDYKEWLDQKEYSIVRALRNLWDKIYNSNFMIRHRYKRSSEDEEMLTNSEWHNWLQELKNEWSRYNVYLHQERTKWFQEKEIEFRHFIENFQFKWMHYNKELLEDHSFDVYKKSLKWNDTKWIKWIERDGESIMMMDIEKWIDQIRKEYNLWLLKDWEQWKSNKILDWLLSEKKCDQYQYWLKWEYSNEKPSLRNEKLDWYKWKKVRKNEAKDWKKWVHEKDQALIEVKDEIWENWKEEKKNVFFSMLNHFINNWIAKKQWKVWVLDLERTCQSNVFI